jgi:hypothetical protein
MNFLPNPQLNRTRADNGVRRLAARYVQGGNHTMIFHSWTYNGRDSVPSKPGIYILYLNDSLQKITEIDMKGILYIGESSNLKSRLKLVVRPQWKRWYEKNTDQMFSHPILTFAVDFDDKYDLMISSGLTSNGLLKKRAFLKLKYAICSDHKNCEKKLLEGHFMSFGQLPPFNVRGATIRSMWDCSKSRWNTLPDYYEKIMKPL